MADARPAAQDAAHIPFVLVPSTTGAPPTRRADLDRDDRVGRKYDHSPESWLAPQPLAATLQVGCACGWRSDPFPTPPGTRLAEPLPATATFRLPVVLTVEGFHQLCHLEWLAHLADAPPATPPPEAAGRPHPRAAALTAERVTDLLRAGAHLADDAPVAAENFLDAGIDPPLTWGELRALCTTRRARLTAPEAAPVDKQLAQLLAVGAGLCDDAEVAPEDFFAVHVEPPLTWGELRSLCATRRTLLAATDAATADVYEYLAEQLPPRTATAAAEAIRAVLRARYSLPPALSANGTPLHLADEFGAAFGLTAEEQDELRRRLMTGGPDSTASDKLDPE